MPETSEQYGKLPWRGPEIPVYHDAAEDRLPQDRLFVQVEQLDMSLKTGRDLYADVLNRVENGFAKVLAQQVMESDGGFMLLLVSVEKYQCGPAFVPAEAQPVILSNSRSNLVMDGDTDMERAVPVFGTPVPVQVPAVAESEIELPDVGAIIRLKSRDDTSVEG